MKTKVLYMFSLTTLRLNQKLDDLVDMLNYNAEVAAFTEDLYQFDETGTYWPEYYIEPTKIEYFTDNPGQWPLLRMHFEVRKV